MSSLRTHSARLLIAGATVGLATAQQITIPGTTASFGAEALIVGDVDGGGRLDVVISDAGPAGLGQVSLISTETNATLGSLTVPPELGLAMTNLGNLDGIPGDEFAASIPNSSLVIVFNGIPVSGTLVQLNAASVISGTVLGFGATLATLPDLNGDGRAEMAVGSSVANVVQVIDPITGALLYSITDFLAGGFGGSLAVSGNRLAVGAPNWSATVPPNLQVGYVDVFTLGTTAATLNATFAAPGGTGSAQRFGNSLASIGDLDGDGLSEFAIQAPAGASSVHIFSQGTPNAPMSSATYTATGPAGGRMAALGDVDGDSRGDFAMSDGTSLFIFGTPNNTTLSQLISVPPTSGVFSGAVVSGPDVLKQGVRDLVTGEVLASGVGQVRVEPLAVLRNLPNPAGLTIQIPTTRPLLGANYPLIVATTNPTSVLASLVVDFAPPKNTPFANGTAFVSTNGSAVVLGTVGISPATPVTFTGINLPSAAIFLLNGLVFQAVALTQSNTLIVSNALLVRLGSF